MAFVYYASFIPGLQDLVGTIVKERLEDARIKKLLDGAMVFETHCTYDRLSFFCFNNIFLVISIIENPGADHPLEAHMKRASAEREPDPRISGNNQRIRSFRVIGSYENKLVPLNEKIKRETERFIARQSRLSVNRTKPDTEFWFLYRREGFSIFMKRLTKHPSFEKALHPGELPPQLAYLMCRLAEPGKNDILLDPFCGYGSIPSQSLKHFPLKQFWAFDLDPAAVKITHTKIRGTLRERCRIQRADIYDIFSWLPAGGVDKIITDPPWGLYQASRIPLEQFYEKILEIFEKLLKPAGTLVLLTAQGEALAAGLTKFRTLEPRKAIPILLSGKKAGIFVIKKTEPEDPSIR
ncbi:MAG: methyltransferase [Spirochaetaceae bacterium]|jgi:predicted RNA methylase|nr:methyltransferase [Spirochaetaceae bacterium]